MAATHEKVATTSGILVFFVYSHDRQQDSGVKRDILLFFRI